METHTSNTQDDQQRPNSPTRRYDIDWIRVIAVFLLIMYHAGVMFQPWAHNIYFIQFNETLSELWAPGSLVNIWRLPILFLVSGMGMYFSIQRRSWKQLLAERSLRIALPYIFGFFTLAPLHIFTAQIFYDDPLVYYPNEGHLWFLLNILIYIVILLPVVYAVKNRAQSKFVAATHRAICKAVQKFPPIILLFVLPMLVEAALLPSEINYATFVNDIHGFPAGFVYFVLGFVFLALGDALRLAIRRVKLPFLVSALALFALRLFYFELEAPHVLSAFEAFLWIISALGFADTFLNKPSAALRYLSIGVFPIYIIHFLVQNVASFLVMLIDTRTEMSGMLQFILVCLLTTCGSLLFYEIIRRIPYLRLLFGVAEPRLSTK